MLKKYIYLSIIAIVTFSCSDLSSEIIGEWTLESNTLHSKAKLLISDEDVANLGPYKVQEFKEKQASALSLDVVFSFEEDGDISIRYSNKQDSWTKSGKWNLESDILEVSLDGDSKKKYSLDLDGNSMTVEDVDTNDTFKLTRKTN